MAKPDAPSSEPDDDDPVTQAEARFAICEEAWSENRRLALEDYRFARLEEQWPERLKRERDLDFRPSLTLNQLHAFIFQVVNDARQNKPGVTVHPVGDGADVATAEIFNGLIRHIEQSSDADVAYDTAMDFAVSCGFGYFRINTRYANDDNFDQDLVVERVANPFAVYPDPHSTAADSSDWNECFILDATPKKAFEKKYPGKDAVSFDGGNAFASREAYDDEDMIVLAEYWTREEVTRTIVALSPPVGDVDDEGAEQLKGLIPDNMIVELDVYEANKALFDTIGVTILGRPRDVLSHKVTQRILSGADELETVAWAGKHIPIVPVWGEELNIEGKRVLRSLIRGAHDAQRMFNYWNTTATEQVALAPKAPYIGKKGAFVTDATKWATANTDNHAYIEYDGAEPPQRQPFAGVPAGAIQQAAAAQQNIMSIIGVYKASLGASSNEDSGVAINARDRQADTGTFHFIDNLSRALRHGCRILLDLFPKVYSTPRLLRILQPDGSPDMVRVNQPTQVPQVGPNGQPLVDPQTQALAMVEKVFDLTQGRYDLTVQVGPSFATKREEFVKIATDLIRADPRLAAPLSDLIIRNYDIPDADEVMARIKAMQGQDPQMMQAKNVIQGGMKQIQALQAQVQQMTIEKADRSRKLEIEAYDAETDRMRAILGKDGAPADAGLLNQAVMRSLLQVIQTPGLTEAMASGAPPEQLMSMVAPQGVQPGPATPTQSPLAT